MPRITVLMTVYNGMPYLPQAVESVLTQRFDDFQLLVADLYDLYCEQFPAAVADPGMVAELARHYGRLLRHSRKGPLHKLRTALYAGGKVFGYWRKARG